MNGGQQCRDMDTTFEEFLDECKEDHVGLWRLANAAERLLGDSAAPERRALGLSLARRLLDNGMLVGHPAPDGRHFVSWDLPTDVALQRIDREWAALGRDPDIGEIAWFTSPDEPS